MEASAATRGPGSHEAADVVARMYREYASRLTRYCRGLVGSEQEAEDAVQTTFVHAFQALRRGAVPECESAWLYTIARNVCLSERRAAGGRSRHSTDVELETVVAPDRKNEELAGALTAALAALPERQRRALVMREWLGLSSGEVAARLGMRTSETYALLTRARQTASTALTATIGRTAAALNLGPLVLKLRALLVGGAAKTATTAAAVVALSAGGAAIVDRSADPGSAVTSAPRTAEANGATTGSAPVRQRTQTKAGTPLTTTRRSRPILTKPSAAKPPDAPPPSAGPGSGPASETPGAAATPVPASPAPPAGAGVPKVDLVDSRTAIEDLLPPEVSALLPPLDETVDALVPPEVEQVVESVDETLSAVTGLVPPLPQPPQLPQLLPPPPPVPPLLP